MALLEYEKFSGTGDLDLTARGKSQLYGILVRESATTPAAATVLVRFPGGVYVDVAAGEVEGSVVGQWGA